MITRYLIQEWNEDRGDWENIRIYKDEQLAEMFRLDRINKGIDEEAIMLEEVEYVCD